MPDQKDTQAGFMQPWRANLPQAAPGVGAGQPELPPRIRVGGSGQELGGEAHWSMAPASWHLWEQVQQVAVTLHAPESKRRLSEDGFARVPPPTAQFISGIHL